ncbi:sulfate transporter 4.1 [Immersiella caudata]|uniref:Sulfate transporter 4.1 n=1 Tax=Immersiella caudata TaxID=314043 RepID=A0AA40BV43_9PEZI|nr:sulfate transporter 4.1 [Immersiella caudata]
MNYVERAKNDVATDVTWNRVARLTAKGARALPSASVEYVTEKFPIIGWLPKYNYRWVINDIIAGLTVGLMLIPQALSYAKIATIPVQYGLMSSWLPSAIYTFMGSTKDVSTGPTSLIGLLTSEIIEDLEHSEWTPSEIASAVALMMGVYGMVVGFLKLGFLLDFVSLPVLSGFISAVAITIILNQIPSLLGETNVGSGTATQIHDVFHELPRANGLACAVGFTGIFLLVVLEQSGKRWGTKNKVVWFLANTRAFITLLIFTGVGYAVNKNRGDPKNYLFDVAQVRANGQEPPRVPSAALISEVATRSITVFVGATIEHVAIARAFGVRNNYLTDQTQEITYFGVANFFNSFFHAMGVGGAMSRTAVNSAANVKSPLSGLITTAVVLISIFKLVGTLYWIPKATLAAIIVTAVFPLISGPTVFYNYWKTSLADFISSMIAFWVSLFVSTEIGIASSVGFNVLYVLLRQVFTRVSSTPDKRSELAVVLDEARNAPSSIPPDTSIFRFNESIFFPNAFRTKSSIMDTIQTHHAPSYDSAFSPEAERNWSVVGEKRIKKLRRRANITNPSGLPPIRLVVIDFIKASHADSTACTHLKALVREIKKYGGESVNIRFAGISRYVRQRFERAGWRLVDGEEPVTEEDEKEVVRVYDTVAAAVMAPRQAQSLRGTDDEDSEKAIQQLSTAGGKVTTTTHQEKVG